MTLWLGRFPLPERAHPLRPWYRRAPRTGFGAPPGWTRWDGEHVVGWEEREHNHGRTSLWEFGETEILPLLRERDHEKPLPAPPPFVGQVWIRVSEYGHEEIAVSRVGHLSGFPGALAGMWGSYGWVDLRAADAESVRRYRQASVDAGTPLRFWPPDGSALAHGDPLNRVWAPPGFPLLPESERP